MKYHVSADSCKALLILRGLKRNLDVFLWRKACGRRGQTRCIVTCNRHRNDAHTHAHTINECQSFALLTVGRTNLPTTL
eukprot:2924269-Amphidinium_carterae.1